MKFKFYLGICIAVFMGMFFAVGIVGVGTFVYKELQTRSYTVYQPQDDLGAKTLYELKEEEIFEKQNDNNYHLVNDSKDFPNLTASAYLVADLETGQLLKQKASQSVYPIASLTKLMTALVSVETIDQWQQTKVSYSAVGTYGKQGNLSSGQKILISELLYPLLLESSNDAAEVLAEHDGRNFFMANLNGKAQSIGLFNTLFEDPSGLSPQNVSTAEDLFKLTQYIYRNEPKILEISRLKDYQGNENKWFNNSHFRSDDYLGGKNGYTDEALYSLISIFELPLVEDKNSVDFNRKVVIILLKSNDVKNDTRATINWLLKNVYYK